METIDVKVKLPKLDGYEYTGDYRRPKKGEWYLSSLTGVAIQASYDYNSEFCVLREVWQEPRTADGQPLLPHGWIARNEEEDLYWHSEKPRRNVAAGYWILNDGANYHYVDWLLPDCPLTWDDEPLEVGRRDA